MSKLQTVNWIIMEHNIETVKLSIRIFKLGVIETTQHIMILTQNVKDINFVNHTYFTLATYLNVRYIACQYVLSY